MPTGTAMRKNCKVAGGAAAGWIGKSGKTDTGIAPLSSRATAWPSARWPQAAPADSAGAAETNLLQRGRNVCHQHG